MMHRKRGVERLNVGGGFDRFGVDVDYSIVSSSIRSFRLGGLNVVISKRKKGESRQKDRNWADDCLSSNREGFREFRNEVRRC
ncbi:MAG: hypothetical protein ACUVQ8_05990 [Nitrososphaeria archaeon]